MREAILYMFWTRWSKKYLLELQSARRLRSSDSSGIQVEDVLLRNDYRPRSFRNRNVIDDIFSGKDGKFVPALFDLERG